MKLISKRTQAKMVRAMERFINGGADRFLMWCAVIFGGLTLLRVLFSPAWPIVVIFSWILFLICTSDSE